MKYRIDPVSGKELSVLGLGCMRFPRGLNSKIDIDKTEKLVMSAIDGGINYFDTAYIYAGSEQALGEVFARNPGAREKIYLATKLPHGQCQTYEDFDRIFDTQLERLRTDYIDYYLIHNLPCMADWERIRGLGVEKWIAEQKAKGRIRRIGFSFHGFQDEFLALLEAYDWEFCQIQYNYMNENYQAGRKGLLRAHAKGLPVVVMEPLLGGKLAAGLPREADRLLREADGGKSPAEWALRWLWDQREVTTVLSGMNSQRQLEENLRTAAASGPGMMAEREAAVIARVVAAFQRSYKIPCTGCDYCQPCPRGVNISACFTAYNISYTSGYITGMMQYVTGTAAAKLEKGSGARRCVGCGKCEKECPQHIAIINSLEMVGRRMEPFWFAPAVRLFVKIFRK